MQPPGEISTPYVRTPGLVSAECVKKNGHSYLAVTVHDDPADPRADNIPGDLMFMGRVVAEWGLHMIEMGLTMGDLLDLVERQTEAYLSR